MNAATGEPTRSAPVRLGVIGAGWFVSRRHLPDVQNCDELALSAICRRDPEQRARVAEHFGVDPSHAYGEWREMLECEALDAVLIATPNALHFEHAKAALERGLHVLLEKPMTTRSDQAHELVELAASKGLKLGVALNPPFWAHCHRIHRALVEAQIGTLETVSLFWSGSADYLFGKGSRPENMPGLVEPTAYRADPVLNGGGYFADGGPHLVSEMIWTTGLRVRRVTALMDELPCDMRATLNVEFENGAVGSLIAIGDSRFPNRRVRHTFGCSNGTITVTGFDFDTCIHIAGQEQHHFKEADLMPIATPVGNFAAAIAGRAKLFSPGEHGAHVVEVVEAAYLSAETGRAVTLGE